MLKLVKVLVLLAVCGIFAACSTTDANKVASVDVSSNSTYDPIKDPKTVVYNKKSIWFDFDSAIIKPEYQSVITAHAEYLRAN